MKAILSSSVIVAFLMLGSACGKKPCAELKDLCASCEAGSLKDSCEIAHSITQVPLVGGGHSACQEILDEGTYDDCR